MILLSMVAVSMAVVSMAVSDDAPLLSAGTAPTELREIKKMKAGLMSIFKERYVWLCET